MNKYNFVKELEKFFTDNCDNAEDLHLTYGSYNEDEGVFTPSPDRNLTNRNDPDEVVQIKWGENSDEYCTYVRIAMDGPYLIMKDVMKALDHWM